MSEYESQFTSPTGTEPAEPEVPAEAPESRRDCIVVGIGASAGGLDAYKRLLRGLDGDSGMAFVLVQHLDPTHESLMAELLSKYTAMPIVQVGETMTVEPNTVYMIPPNRFIRIHGQVLSLDEPVRKRGVRLPIDYFFSSLARARRERAIGIVLSGTGGDGADGLREIKAEGGMTIAQRPEQAEFDGMPTAALATGAVDRVLALEEMGEAILAYARHAYVVAPAEETLAAAAPDHFRAILSLLKAQTDQDFTRYKHGTLARRIERRMGIRYVDTAADYLKLLREDADELNTLFKDLLIGVTRFFRDRGAWDQLTEILAQNLRDRRNAEAVRVWVPGCATGEEAYSLAMLLVELQQQQNKRWDIQVFATDIDSDAIETARLGVYPENIAKDLSEPRLEAFFERDGGRLRVKKRLREACIFAVQSLLSDAPFSNLDLISCRNLLIYLESDIQQRVLDVFHFGLKPQGILFLGNSESPNKRVKLFKTLSQPSRIYQKIGASRPGAGSFPVVTGSRRGLDAVAPVAGEERSLPVGAIERSKKALLEEFAPASVVVNHRGVIQYIHGPVRNYLDFPSGEPELELTTMALEGLKAKTRTALHQARSANETVSLLAPRVPRGEGQIAVRLRVQPLPGAKGSEQLFLVSFLDEAPARASAEAEAAAGGPALPAEAEDSRQLALELAATREDLQSTIEELESANEELKASNEEVMSMNEELQSTNEELETSREELQSLNEELSTVNNQLQGKVGELEAVTNDLANLLASTDMATLFLDQDLRIRRFTPATMRLMSLREGDVGRPLSDLASRVEDTELAADACAVLETLAPVQREVRQGAEQWFMRRVTPFRTADNRIEGVVVTYSDMTEVRQGARRLECRERQQATIAQLGRAALAGEPPQALLERAVQLVAATLEVDLVKVLRLEPGRRTLRLVAGVGWDEGLIGTTTVPVGIESQGGYTLEASGPVISRDLRKEKRFSGPDLLARHGVVSGMSVVIGPEDEPWGVLSVHARSEVEFTVDDTNFIIAVANLLWEANRREAVAAQLRANEARTAAFLDNSAIIAWMKDDQGRHLYFSRTFERRMGIRAEDCLGKTDDELWPAAIAETFRANDERVRETGKVLEAVEEAVGPEGEQLYFLVSKFPFVDARCQACVGGLGVDITERVRAERALAESEERLREAARMARFGTYYGDLDAGLLKWSPELKEILGYQCDADIEVGIGEVPAFVHPDDRARLAERMARSFDPAGDGVFADEHRVVRPDGAVRWIAMQGRTAFAGEGASRRAVRLAGTALDVTERRLFEEELKDARGRAEAASEAKSQFLANMSHEIRTPLTAILGFADVLEMRLESAEDQACVATIKRSGDHLRQILDDFLDLAKIESGRLHVVTEPCDLVAVVADIQSLFVPRASQKGLSLVVERRGEVPRRIATDPKCLRQILLNLLGNAIKFTDSGGVRLTIECLAPEERIEIAVADTGVGIAAERLQQVFEPFEQVDMSSTKRAGGTGLGLSITKRLVDALGGEVRAESAPGRGSSFIVRLPTGPLGDAEWLGPEAEVAPPGEDRFGADRELPVHGRVLAVDDNGDVRTLVRALIEAAGCEAAVAPDGTQALACWRRERDAGRDFDAVLLDIQMPAMDGHELSRRLRAAGCTAPIIALTANAMQRDREAALAAGCDDFLRKPIERIALLKTLAHWLGRSPAASPGGRDPEPAGEDNADREAGGAERDRRAGGLSVLCVDDHLDTCSAQQLVLELHGYQVVVAGSAAEALEAVDRLTPDAALIDLGLQDMSGDELLARLRERPELRDCLFVCVSGREADEVAWPDFGFHAYLQKPVQLQALLAVLGRARASAQRDSR